MDKPIEAEGAELWSACCLSSMRVVGGNEGTNHYVCNACDKPCNWTDKQANPAPRIEADKELDEMFGPEELYGECYDVPALKTALLAWRDKAVVAELEAVKKEVDYRCTNDLQVAEIYKDSRGTVYKITEVVIADRLSKLKAIMEIKE